MKPELSFVQAEPIAISYVRFSSPEQRKGDSLRRQTEATAKWCEKNGLTLDQSLSFQDAGRSAYHGRHRSDKAALGRFLDLTKEGRVPRGSYLVIENLDRLSREDERTALRLWLDILDAGINIVQLHPETVFRHERSDMVDIIRAIIELSRGHSESRIKSVRAAGNWAKAFKLAREQGRKFTRRLPGWLEMTDDGRLALIPGRAAVVRRLFEMAKAGYGMSSIVKKLLAEGVPAFGGRVADEGGGHRKVDGDHYGCGEWRTSYVRYILSDRRAIGEFQPRDTEGRKQGEVIADYYPAVVSPEEFQAARAAILGRKSKQGRIGKNVANLFGGLLKNARDGSTYYAATRSDKWGFGRMLLNRSSIETKARAYTFPYQPFESAVLSRLREINPDDVEKPPPVGEVHVLQGELSWVRQQKGELALELMKGYSPTIGEAIKRHEAREADLAARIAEKAEMVAVPRINTWEQAKGLVALLEGADDVEDVRLRLRSALRRIVSEIWLVVVPRGRHRLCAVQMWFADGKTCRNYLILHKPAWAGRAGRKPADTSCISFPRVGSEDDLDLRQPDQAAELVRALEELSLA